MLAAAPTGSPVRLGQEIRHDMRHDIRQGIDLARLRRLQGQAPGPPMQTIEPLVLAHSKDLGCRELLVWEQVNHGQELYIPPVDRYDVFLRLAATAPVVQWRDGTMDVRHHAAGEVVVVPPYQALYFKTFGPGRNLHCSVLPELLARAAGCDRAVLRNSFGERDAVIAGIGHVLQQHLRAPGLQARAFVESVAMALAIQLLERFGQQPAAAAAAGRLDAARLQRIDAYVASRLHERITLQQLADLCGLPPHAFYRAFKASRALPPLRHVLNERMRRARALVEGTRRPVGDIAVDVGFADLAHFSNSFRRHWGVAPTQLRRHR